MGRRRYSAAERRRAIDLYAAGGTIVTVADEIGCSSRTVLSWLKASDVKVNLRNKRLTRAASQCLRDQMVNLFDSGLSAQAISDKLKLSYGIVVGELRRRGRDLWSARNASMCRFNDDPVTRQHASKLYEAGASMNELAKDLRCSVGAVKKALETEGVKIRGRAESHGVLFESSNGRSFCMRSTWEVRTAVWLDRRRQCWDYEYETFSLPSGLCYTPDFWIYTDASREAIERLVDVKGYQWEFQSEAIEEFRSCYPDLSFEIWGEDQLCRKGVFGLPLPVLPRVGNRCRTPKWKLDLLVGAYAGEGLTLKEAGARVGLTESGAGHHLRRLGITRSSEASKRRKSGRGDAWLNKLQSLYLDGCSMGEIGRQLGVNSGTVHYHLQRLKQNRGKMDGDLDNVDVRVVAGISGV